jgi:hypothetical protein
VSDVQRKSAPVSGRILWVIAAAAIALAGCSSVKGAKQGPDETAVATRSPLVVPATFDLKPPQPGAPRPQDADTAAAAERVLGGGTTRPAPASEGEQALLAATGANRADPKIRQELRQEVRQASKRKSYADTVLFWRGDRIERGTPLNPGEEERRMKVARPAAQPAPVIERAAPTPADAAAEVKEKAADEKAKAEEEDEDEDDDSGGWFDWF